MTDPKGSPLSLSLPVDDIVSEVEPPQAEAAAPVEDPELSAMADDFVAQVLADPQAVRGQDAHRHREAVDGMGAEIQKQAARRSSMLQVPIRKLAHQGDEGGPVAQALMQLRGYMAELDPNRHDLSESAVSRLLAVIPGMGSRVKRYFHKFETAQEMIDGIIKDLQAGRDMLRRDNITLADDQGALRDILDRLRRQIDLGRLIDGRLAAAAEKLPEGADQRLFIEEELLFPLRQRVIDLQQQLAVSQQGILALEVIIRNNRELIRGVDRAIDVTVSALNVAVTVAIALANQRLVLDRVEALNSTTSDLIAGTSKALRTQGVEIQNRAASSVLDMQKLEQAFADVLAAIDEVGRYRRDALPKLDAQIDRLDALAGKGEEAIRRLEKGNVSQAGTAL